MKFQRQIPRGRGFFKDEVGRKPSRFGFRKETMFIHLGAQCSHFVNLPISKGELPNFTDQILQLSPIVYIYIQRYTMIWIRSSKYLQFQAPMFATHQVRNNFMVSPPTATTASFQGPQPAARSTADTTGNRGRNGVSLVIAGGFVEMSPHGWLISRGTTPLPIFRPVHQAVGHDENLLRFEDHEISGCRTMDSCGLVCCVSKLGTSVHFI